MTTNDQYKIKLWNPSAESSRRTCLGPTYGGKITKMKRLDVQGQADRYLVYSTPEKVIGLIQMPLTGNPNQTMGLIAHPKQITDFCCSRDGRFLFTCGGDDLSVKMWAIDVTPIQAAVEMGGQGKDDVKPFVNLIEGGEHGQTYSDMQDFFYYSMIRSKDENTTKTRELNEKVPLDELPYLMRAMGYYPTEMEVNNMREEVRFSHYSETGEPREEIKIEDFIKLFVNHRPVYGIGKNDIEQAFKDLVGEDGGLAIARSK